MYDGPAPDSSDELGLSQAIARASRRLVTDQSADGAWHYGNAMDPRITALAFVVERYLGVLADADPPGGLEWLRREQREDGSFPAYVDADHGGIAVTGTCLAGLVACGAGEDAPAVRCARAFLGTRVIDPGTRLVMAMAGAIPVDRLESQQLWIFAIPGALKMLETRFSAGAIMFLMALAAVGDGLRRRSGGPGRGLLGETAGRRIERFLFALQDPNGSFFDLPLSTCWFLAALHGAGVPASDPRMKRALAYLESRKRRDERGLHLVSMDSEVWNTALCLRALAAAGVPEHLDAVNKGAEALRAMQILETPTPRLFQPKPDAPRVGRFAFTASNPLQPDTDDTGVAIAGLASLLRDGLGDAATARAVDEAVEWLLAMQNPDGGWAAFAYGLPKKKPGAMDANLLMNPPTSLRARIRLTLRPPPEMGDPSTSDLTGRVLYALGRAGFSAGDPPVERAIAFLKRDQVEETGAFWANWMVNYLPGTACVLAGLASVNADLDAPWVRQAIDFVLNHQNQDGGFGELPSSYLDPKLAGKGPSMPALTGLVVWALVEAGLGDQPAVRRGVEYLLRMQGHDGGWKDTGWLQVVLFPDTLYRNEAHPNCFPLDALAAYRDHLRDAPGARSAGAPRAVDRRLPRLRARGSGSRP